MSKTKSEKTVFLRDATGLVREFGAREALFLAAGTVISIGWGAIFAGMWSTFPGVSIPITFSIVGILGALNGLYYIMIGATMPRAGGGGYLPLSRTIHPVLATGSSFILVLAMVLNTGYVASVTPILGISGPIQVYGAAVHNTGLQSIGSMIGTHTGSFVIGSIVILFVVLSMIFASAVSKRIIWITFVLGLTGFFLVFIVLGTTPNSQFVSSFNSITGSGTYQNITTTASNSGLSIPAWQGPTLLALPLAFYALLGYAWNVYYAGEIKRVNRSLTIGIIGSIVLAVVIYSSVALLTQNMTGSNFMTSASYLFNTHPNSYPTTIPPWITALVAIANSNLFVNSLAIASYVAMGILSIFAYLYIASRLMLAWSFDRVVPSFLGRTSERFHSPVVTIIISGILAEIGLYFYALLPSILGPVNLVFIFVFGLIFDGLAGIALIFRKNLLQSAPSFVKKKIAGIPVISVLGAYSVALLVSIFALSLYNPTYAGPFGVVTISTVIVTFVVGVVSYVGMRVYLARQGIDASLAFKEIPPE